MPRLDACSNRCTMPLQIPRHKTARYCVLVYFQIRFTPGDTNGNRCLGTLGMLTRMPEKQALLVADAKASSKSIVRGLVLQLHQAHGAASSPSHTVPPPLPFGVSWRQPIYAGRRGVRPGRGQSARLLVAALRF